MAIALIKTEQSSASIVPIIKTAPIHGDFSVSRPWPAAISRRKSCKMQRNDAPFRMQFHCNMRIQPAIYSGIRLSAVISDMTNQPTTVDKAKAILASALPISAPQTPVPSKDGSEDVQAMVCVIKGKTLDEIERIAVEAAVKSAGGSLPLAAKALGVSPSTLYRKRQRWLAG